MVKPARFASALVLAPVLALVIALAGCGGGGDGPATVANAPRERSVDPAEAVRLINAHRAAHGKPALRVDGALSAIAAQTAATLARRNEVKTELHTRGGLKRRLEGAGYEAGRAAENLGAGYPTLASAVAGWKASRRHNRTLLNPDLSNAGIGLALTDSAPYHSFWVLILATPLPNTAP